jgi:hypothetical protein
LAYLNEGTERYLALFVTHDSFWKSFAAEAGIAGFATMAERTASREEVLAKPVPGKGTPLSKPPNGGLYGLIRRGIT